MRRKCCQNVSVLKVKLKKKTETCQHCSTLELRFNHFQTQEKLVRGRGLTCNRPTNCILAYAFVDLIHRFYYTLYIRYKVRSTVEAG